MLRENKMIGFVVVFAIVGLLRLFSVMVSVELEDGAVSSAIHFAGIGPKITIEGDVSPIGDKWATVTLRSSAHCPLFAISIPANLPRPPATTIHTILSSHAFDPHWGITTFDTPVARPQIVADATTTATPTTTPTTTVDPLKSLTPSPTASPTPPPPLYNITTIMQPHTDVILTFTNLEPHVHYDVVCYCMLDDTKQTSKKKRWVKAASVPFATRGKSFSQMNAPAKESESPNTRETKPSTSDVVVENELSVGGEQMQQIGNAESPPAQVPATETVQQAAATETATSTDTATAIETPTKTETTPQTSSTSTDTPSTQPTTESSTSTSTDAPTTTTTATDAPTTTTTATTTPGAGETAVAKRSAGCVMWRQTGSCSPQGSREVHMDKPCDSQIMGGNSGFCECTDGLVAAPSTCDHAAFNCREMCNQNAEAPPPPFSSKIPMIIHQTWKDKNNLGRWNGYCKSWPRHNPDFEIRIYDDNDMNDIVRAHFPSIAELFAVIPIIAKADLFRYLVLQKFGGVYADVDVECERPIKTWAHFGDAKFAVGIEFDARSLPDYRNRGFARPLQFCQWTMASVPDHPILKCVVDAVRRSVDRLVAEGRGHPSKWAKSDVLDVSGPGPWSDCVHAHIAALDGPNWDRDDTFPAPKVHGDHDVVVLPYISFGFHQLHHLGGNHEYRYVRHWYGGTWHGQFKSDF